MDILTKIEELKAKYNDPIDAPQLTVWEEEAKRLLLIDGIAGNDAVKYLINELATQVQAIDAALLMYDSTKLSDSDRDRLIDRKQLFKRVISYFDVESAKKELEKQIDAN